MFNNFEVMTYPEARYAFLKELDTRGPIGRLLLIEIPQLTNSMMRAAEFIDTIATLEEHQYVDCGIDNDVRVAFCQIGERLPRLMLLESELDWNTFVNAYCAFMFEYTKAIRYNADLVLCNAEKEHPESAEELILHANDAMHMADEIEYLIKPALRLIEIGIGYTELLEASAHIVEELRSWQQSRPASLRLSKAYLDAMGIVSKE